MKYDCLIASGCSHTFGEEMSDVTDDIHPSKFSWPQMLGNYLNIDDVYNVASPGGSNDYISRSLVKEIEKHSNKKILVGFMLSYLTRFEIVKVNEKDQIGSWWNVGSWKADEPNTSQWIIDYYIHGQNDFADSYRTLKNIHYLQLYLESKNIDYFFVNSSKREEIDMSLKIANDDLKIFDTLINWDCFFNNNNMGFSDWCQYKNFKWGPRGHNLEDASDAFVNQQLGPWVKNKFFK